MGPSVNNERIWSLLVILATFESQMSFCLSDNQEVIRTRSERAFNHLQRLIVADDDMRKNGSAHLTVENPRVKAWEPHICSTTVYSRLRQMRKVSGRI
jgi:hypothetical protein